MTQRINPRRHELAWDGEPSETMGAASRQLRSWAMAVLKPTRAGASSLTAQTCRGQIPGTASDLVHWRDDSGLSPFRCRRPALPVANPCRNDPMPDRSSPKRRKNLEVENEDLKPQGAGKPPRPASEPSGSEKSSRSPKTMTDPASGES